MSAEAPTAESPAGVAGQALHPRTARARSDLLAAAIEILTREGYGALTMDQIAAEARSSKQTIYRLWSSKEALVADALTSYVDEYPDPDTGNLRDDLIALITRQIRVLTSTKHGRALAAAYASAADSRELHERVREPARRARHEAMAKIIARGVERSELCQNTDADLLIDLLLSPALVHIMLHGQAVDEAYGRRVVDSVIRAFDPHPPSSCSCR